MKKRRRRLRRVRGKRRPRSRRPERAFSVSRRGLKVLVHETRGTVSLARMDGSPLISSFWIEIELAGGDVLTSCQSGLKRTGSGWAGELANGRLAFSLSFKPCSRPSGLFVLLSVRNQGDETVRIRELRPMHARLESGVAGSPGSWRVLKLNHAFGGAHREDQDDRASALIRLEESDAAVRSFGATAVSFQGTPSGLLAGFTTSSRQLTWIDIARDREESELTASCETEGAEIAPGASCEAETFYVGVHDDLTSALGEYGALCARAARVRLKPVPKGWCSRYGHSRRDVNAAGVRDAVRFLKERGKRMAMKVVQLDDGYQSACGDWLAGDSRFPGGLEELAREVRKAGLTPGLWIAPFAAEASSALAKEHPDWMVGDPAGNPLSLDVSRGQTAEPWHALDGSHREVSEWLTGLFRALRRLGFAYFKLDLLFLGCMKGTRAKPVTRVEAYRRGLKAIRKGAGAAYLAGCAAPYAASIGLLDGMRTGGDIYRVEDSTLCFSDASAQTHQRFWTHRTLWNADPDVLPLAEIGGAPPELSRAIGLSAAFSGGALMSGDVLAKMPAGRLKLLAEALAVSRPAAATPLDLFEEERPRLLLQKLGGKRFRLAILNHDDSPRVVTLDLERLGLRKARVAVVEEGGPGSFWRSGRRLSTSPIPARGAVVFAIEGG